MKEAKGLTIIRARGAADQDEGIMIKGRPASGRLGCRKKEGERRKGGIEHSRQWPLAFKALSVAKKAIPECRRTTVVAIAPPLSDEGTCRPSVLFWIIQTPLDYLYSIWWIKRIISIVCADCGFVAVSREAP